jgi:hypothetical protein
MKLMLFISALATAKTAKEYKEMHQGIGKRGRGRPAKYCTDVHGNEIVGLGLDPRTGVYFLTHKGREPVGKSLPAALERLRAFDRLQADAALFKQFRVRLLADAPATFASQLHVPIAMVNDLIAAIREHDAREAVHAAFLQGRQHLVDAREAASTARGRLRQPNAAEAARLDAAIERALADLAAFDADYRERHLALVAKALAETEHRSDVGTLAEPADAACRADRCLQNVERDVQEELASRRQGMTALLMSKSTQTSS